MMQLDLVIFDLGGTLIEDAGHVPTAFQQALELHGYSVTPAALSRFRGASKREVIRSIVGGEEDAAERVYRSFQERLIQLFEEHGVRAIEGIAPTMARLLNAGVRIAVTTGFDRRITDGLLDPLDFRGILGAVVCGDDVSAGRPAPYMIFRAMEQTGAVSVHRVANVGDTTNDLQAGYRAGVAANVGVLTGAHGETQMRQAPHTHILASAALVYDALVSGDVAGS